MENTKDTVCWHTQILFFNCNFSTGDVNVKNQHEDTPLLLAIRRNLSDSVLLLLNKEAGILVTTCTVVIMQ